MYYPTGVIVWGTATAAGKYVSELIEPVFVNVASEHSLRISRVKVSEALFDVFMDEGSFNVILRSLLNHGSLKSGVVRGC